MVYAYTDSQITTTQKLSHKFQKRYVTHFIKISVIIVNVNHAALLKDQWSSVADRGRSTIIARYCTKLACNHQSHNSSNTN